MFTQNFNYGNQSFYGKKVTEFTEKEMSLLENDMMLSMSISMFKRGESITSSNDEIEMGTEKSIRHFLAMRYAMISDIMDIEVEDDIISEITSTIDNSDYGWKNFQRELVKNSNEFHEKKFDIQLN
jgi:hypothetical protein